MSRYRPTRPSFLPFAEESGNSSEFSPHLSIVRLTAVACLALGLSACQEEAKTSEALRPVKAVVVQKQSGDVIKTFSGDIRAHTESALGFRVAGKIVERLVDVGDRVTAGEVIARLDDTDLVLTQNSARAAVASAKTRLAVARDALGRAETLQPKGYTPSSVVDQRRLETDAAEAALQAAEAQARQAANATGYAVLKADKDGIVTAAQAEAGQVVAAGTPVVIVAVSGDSEVALNVPEQDITRLAIDQNADLTLWADDTVKAKGRVSEIAGQADPGSRTYAVRIAIENPPPAMRLGMTATAAIKLNAHTPYLPIPLTALTEIGGRKAVFVVDRTSSKVTSHVVETDGVTENGMKIVSGLEPGDVVVTGGVQFLTDGMQVRLPESLVQTASATDPNANR